VLFQEFIELIVAGRLDLVFAAVDAVMTIDRGDDFPQCLFFGDARRPAEAGAEAYDFGASEASVIVEEPVCLASAGGAFPTGSSGTPTM